jgi:hypothetical protein
MRIRKLIPIVLALLFLSACGPVLTVNPLFEESDRVFEPALLGTWCDGNTSFSFRPYGKKLYFLVYRDGLKQSQYILTVGKVGGQLFMDAYPSDRKYNDAGRPVDQESTEAFLPAVPMHVIMKVDFQDDDLYLALLDQDWAAAHLDKITYDYGTGSIIKTPDDDNIFLTLPTDRLQDFVKSYEDDPGAFPPGEPLRRIDQTGSGAKVPQG